MSDFKPDFILDDKTILWKLHESALKKNSDIANLANQSKFINTAISKNIEKSFSISTNIYELIICDSVKKDEITDIGLFFSILSKEINIEKDKIRNEKKILEKQKNAYKLFKNYLICFCNEIYANNIKEDDILFDLIPLNLNKLKIQNGIIKPIKYQDYSDDDKSSEEIAFAFHIAYSIGLKT